MADENVRDKLRFIDCFPLFVFGALVCLLVSEDDICMRVFLHAFLEGFVFKEINISAGNCRGQKQQPQDVPLSHADCFRVERNQSPKDSETNLTLPHSTA